ncbi:MAG: magnesium transporter [Pseudomonadota bacterium]
MTETPQPVSAEDARELGREDELALDPALVGDVMEAVDAGARDAALARIADLHIADIADLVEQLGSERRRRFIALTWGALDPELLIEVEEGVRDDILDFLKPADVAEAAREFETDDVVYLLSDLDPDEQREVLEALDPADRVAVARSLTYPEYSAGRLMQTDFVRAPAFWTVGQMIDFLRASTDLPEQFYDIVVVDPSMKPVGLIPLAAILGNRRPVVLSGIMNAEFTTFHVEDTQEDVGYGFKQYHLVSAPVLDDDGRIVGVITIDDAVEALDEEAEEDLKRLGGVGDEEISDAIWAITKRRFPWLAVNLATAILASLVIAQFDETIAQIVALAVLMPIVASMGGNAGTQSLTVAVRALATRDLTPTNTLRVVWREAVVGCLNGVGFAVVMGLVAYVWFGDPEIGWVIAAAMVVNMIAAALAGILIPIALDRAGADPALASGTFVTTVTDVVGFLAFLGLAALVLI